MTRRDLAALRFVVVFVAGMALGRGETVEAVLAAVTFLGSWGVLTDEDLAARDRHPSRFEP